MKRIDDDTIALTQAEAEMVRWFIESALDTAWDRHTDTYLCPNVSWEEGKHRMNPEAYAFMMQLDSI